MVAAFSCGRSAGQLLLTPHVSILGSYAYCPSVLWVCALPKLCPSSSQCIEVQQNRMSEQSSMYRKWSGSCYEVPTNLPCRNKYMSKTVALFMSWKDPVMPVLIPKPKLLEHICPKYAFPPPKFLPRSAWWRSPPFQLSPSYVCFIRSKAWPTASSLSLVSTEGVGGGWTV